MLHPEWTPPSGGQDTKLARKVRHSGGGDPLEYKIKDFEVEFPDGKPRSRIEVVDYFIDSADFREKIKREVGEKVYEQVVVPKLKNWSKYRGGNNP